MSPKSRGRKRKPTRSNVRHHGRSQAPGPVNNADVAAEMLTALGALVVTATDGRDPLGAELAVSALLSDSVEDEIFGVGVPGEATAAIMDE